MPYLLTDFQGVALPQAMTKDDLSTGQAESTLDSSIGGVYDVLGTSRRWPGLHEFAHFGKYEGGGNEVITRVTKNGDTRLTKSGDTRVIMNNALANLQAQTDELKALIGTRGAVGRRNLYSGALSWKTCRLLEVQHIEEVDHAGVVSEVTSRFETSMNGWHEAAATIVSANAVNGSPIGFPVTNSGRLTIHDAILTVQRTSGTIASVRLTSAGGAIDLTWSGSIGSGQTLTIDGGLQTVQVAGVDRYSGFVLGPAVNYWLRLPVGVNALTVTVTGGNATVRLTYYNQFP